MVVLGQGGCFCVKVVVFGQKWLYSEKSGCNRANVVVYGKIASIPAKWLYLGKVVEFSQKWLHSGKSGCIRAKVVVFWEKRLYFDKVVVIGQSGCIRAKVVLFG